MLPKFVQEPGTREARQGMGGSQKRRAWSNRSRVADRTKALDCAYSRYNGNGAHGSNAGASSIVFTPEEFKELNAAVADIHVQGQRLPDGVLALSGVEAPPKS